MGGVVFRPPEGLTTSPPVGLAVRAPCVPGASSLPLPLWIPRQFPSGDIAAGFPGMWRYGQGHQRTEKVGGGGDGGGGGGTVEGDSEDEKMIEQNRRKRLGVDC